LDIPEGEYLVKIGLTKGSENYGQYLPTYFGDQVSWDAAQLISLHQDLFESHVHLVPVADMATGIGIINGYISFEGNIPAGSGLQTNIILSDEMNHPLLFTEPDSSGAFAFSGLPFGTYLVRADLAGRPCEPQPVTLSSSNPTASFVQLIINEAALFGMTFDIGNIYPNPALHHLHSDIESIKDLSVEVTVTDIMGKTLMSQNVSLHKGSQTIRMDITSLPSGIYLLRIASSSLTGGAVKKFIK
jgi:hypothetical protein